MKPTAIVTGANRGIGKAVALRLASDGFQVVLAARDLTLLNEVAAQCPGSLPFPVDLRAEDGPQRLVDATSAAFGRIDVVINNAGATKRGDFEALTDFDWTDGYALKLFGAVRLTRASWPWLKAAQGAVINIAGIGGRTPGPEFSIGGSVNAALLAFTKSLADKGIADGVQVNAINPGPVRTDRLTKRLLTISEADFVRKENITRIGEPQEIAALVAFLLSEDGRWMQGSLVDMDGGSTKSL